MTNEEKRIKIAEACGPRLFVIHKPIHDPFGYYRENACGYTNNLTEAWKVTEDVARKYIAGRPTDSDRVIMEPAPTPDYFNDLNATHEVEKVAPPQYWDELAKITGCDGNPFAEAAPPITWKDFASATASQRAEAFGKTLNLW